jgi:6-phosphogluconolactonase
MKTSGIHISKSIGEMATFVANTIKVQVDKAAPNYASIALSGGSTPKTLFKWLSDKGPDFFQWEKVLLFWGDERCVGPDHPESNYKMTRENLLDNIQIPNSNIFRIRGEADPFDEVKRYSELVYSKIPHENQVPRFDLVMLGLGEDGHTASIFPPDIGLFESHDLFADANNPYSGQKRITATGKLINNAKMVVFMVAGKSKAEMVARVIEKQEGYDKLPASLVKPSNGELLWLLDEQAASNLKLQI